METKLSLELLLFCSLVFTRNKSYFFKLEFHLSGSGQAENVLFFWL